VEHSHTREAQLQREEALRLVREESAQAETVAPAAVESPPPAPRHEELRREEPQRHDEPRYEAPREAAPERAEERPAPPPAPKVDPREELAGSGLVMIETDRSRAPEAPAATDESQSLGRPRRERPKSETKDEPLEQVETRK
jgi:hypothetical protein